MSFFDDDGDDEPRPVQAQRNFFDDDDDDEGAPAPIRPDQAQAPAPARPVAGPSRARDGRGSSARPGPAAGRQPSVVSAAAGDGRVEARRENGRDVLAELELEDLVGGKAFEGDEDYALPKESLTEELTRHWWNERCAPEVLMSREKLLEEAMERILQQSEALNTLLASPEGMSNDEFFRLALIETEVEQLRHICKAYARCRMYKFDKHFDHCLSDPYARARLSEVDIQYCEREQALVHNLLYSSVIEALPPKYRRLDEEDMIVRPDLDQAVFVTARRRCGPIELPDSTVITLEKGTRHFFRYRTVRDLVESGDVMLV